jgi:penicillin-binding protein 1C
VAPARFAIASPPDGATYLIDPTLRREFQTLPLRAVAAGARRVEWRVDGRVVGASGGDGTVDWPLAPGAHRVEATDERGRTAGATVTVR